MKQILKKINRLLVQFKKIAATCSKCGDYNEYVEEDPDFVCYKCRTEKARMFGGEEKKKEEELITPNQSIHRTFKTHQEAADLIFIALRRTVFKEKVHMMENSPHRSIIETNLMADKRLEQFDQVLEGILTTYGFDKEIGAPFGQSYANGNIKALTTKAPEQNAIEVMFWTKSK